MQWESVLKDYLGNLQREGVTISYSTEISLEEELNNMEHDGDMRYPPQHCRQ
jgi:hypothetical protein